MATLELKSSLRECISYAPVRRIPRRVVGIYTHTYTGAGELILISAVQSAAGQTELSMSLGDRDAQVVIPEAIPAYVVDGMIDGMIAELGGEYTPGLARVLTTELNAELREARYLEARKARNMERERAGRAKLLAKLSA